MYFEVILTWIVGDFILISHQIKELVKGRESDG